MLKKKKGSGERGGAVEEECFAVVCIENKQVG